MANRLAAMLVQIKVVDKAKHDSWRVAGRRKIRQRWASDTIDGMSFAD
jgi:hypothetical protein